MSHSLNRHALPCVLVLSLAAAASWAQVERRPATPAGAAAGREVRRASCVLQLEFDANRGGRGFDLQTLNALLTSTSLVDPAAEKALKLAPDQWPAVVQLEVVPAGAAAVRLGVTVAHDPEGKLPADAARQLLDELAARAKAVVDSAASRQHKERNERLNGVQAELAAAVGELDRISTKLREARATGELDRVGGVMTVGGFQAASRAERDALEINIQSQRARLAVLEAERERITASAATRPSAQTAAAPWADLIAAREKIVAIVREQRGEGVQQSVALAQAEASLAEAKALAASYGRTDRREFDPAERWQTEIVSLRGNIAEAEARLAAINQRLPKPTTQPAAPPIDVDQLQQDEAAARNRVSELRQLVESVRREQRSAASAPTLNILDGKSNS